MAGNQKSTLKHLLSTLATFTGREKESEKEDSQRRYTGEAIAWPTHSTDHFIGGQEIRLFLCVFVCYFQLLHIRSYMEMF